MYARSGLMILAGIFLLFFAPRVVVATGIYEDPGRLPVFLLAPSGVAVESAIIRTEAPSHQGALYSVAIQLPVKSRYLIRSEITFASLTVGNDIENGFGDFRFRLRTPLARRPQSVLYGLIGARTGSGSKTLFPYSTASVDFEIGLGLADTLSAVTVWGATMATLTTRVTDPLQSNDLHDNFVTFSGGILWPLGENTHVQTGGSGYLFKLGDFRSIAFADVTWKSSEQFALHATIHGDAIGGAEPAVDYAFGIGIRVRR